MTQLVIYSRDFKIYEECLTQHPYLSIKLTYSGQNPSPAVLATADILLGEPDLIAPIIGNYANVKWVQSTWAGNNKFQENTCTSYLLTGVKDIFSQQMTEYVLAYILYLQRNIELYNQNKTDRVWAQAPSTSLNGKTLGIMGIGSIGQAVGKQLSTLGIRIVGLSQTPKLLSNIPVYTNEHIIEFIEQCDYILNLLPETKQTIGLCDSAFFSAMRSGSIFISAGRGTVIDQPHTLISALSEGNLFAAVLDVFEEEPLVADHPYYAVDNLYISCHTAAVSDPKRVFDIFANNLNLFLQNAPLLHRHDFSKGY